MEPTEVLKSHLELCSEVHTLLLEENTWLKMQKKSSRNGVFAKEKIHH